MWVFSARVKQYVAQRVRDEDIVARLTALVWMKRRFRCNTPGCGPSFTESTVQVPARARLTCRLREAIGRMVRTRNVAEVAAEHRVTRWTAWRATTVEAAKVLAARPVCRPSGWASMTTFRRPQRFATDLVDLSSGRLWDLLEGRSKAVVVGDWPNPGTTSPSTRSAGFRTMRPRRSSG